MERANLEALDPASALFWNWQRGWILGIAQAVALELFRLPEESRAQDWGSFPAPFPGLGALEGPGVSFLRKLPVLGSEALGMPDLFFYCNLKGTVIFFCFNFAWSAAPPTTEWSFRSAVVDFYR